MWLRYEQIAAYSNLDFHFAHEVHTQGGQGSAPWGENVTTTQRQLRRTPSSGFDHVWPVAARSAIDFGAFHWFAYGFSHTTSTNGFSELQIDGSLVYSETGIRTSGDGAPWYPKLGFYRWSSISGTDVCYIAGWSLHDARPTYPGGGGEPPSTPGVTSDIPATSGQTFIGTLPYQVSVVEAPSGALLYVGLAPSGVTAPAPFPDPVASGDSVISNALDLSGIPEAGASETMYAALHNSTGAQIGADTVAVRVFPSVPAPPPSGPVLGALEVISDTTVTIAGRLLNPDVVIPLDRVEWARFDLPRQYEVRRARERDTGRWLMFNETLGGLVFDPDAVSPLEED